MLIDTSASLRNPELGYYQVGSTIHTGKAMALIDGTNRNIHPEWKFNNEVFDHFNWKVEPTETLSKLYRQRAVELREKYDYLILSYSAGSDSQVILDTCLKYNIKIDELIVMHPLSFENVYTPSDQNYNIENVLSEWDFNVKPRLQWLAVHRPEIKVTVYDWGTEIEGHKIADDYVLDRNHNISPYYDQRCGIWTSPAIQEKLEKFDRVGVIVGIDKPRICWHENSYKLYFMDLLTAGFGPQNSSKLRSQGKLQVEFFYWHPDCAKMIAKQAHMLVKFFESVPAFKTYITWPVQNPNHRAWYDASVRAIIYPELDLNFFQANKMNNMTIGYDQLLFKIGKKDKVMGIVKDNVTYLQSVIDKKYFNQINGIPTMVGFITGMYTIKSPADLLQNQI